MYLAAEVVVPLLLVTYGACADVNSGHVTLHLGSKSKTVQMVDKEYPTFLDPQITILKTDKLPEKKKLMPSIGNGYLATVVHSDTIYRSDMFNGYNITSHRARIPSTCAINITSISRTIVSSEYWLDVGRGMYREIYKGGLYEIELNMYAHRKYSSLLVTEIYVWNKARSENLTLTLNVNEGDESVDLDILEDKTFPDKSLKKFSARTKEAEYEKFGKQDVVVISSVVPDQLVIDPLSRDSYAFITSISDDVQKATKQFLEGKAAYFNQSLESSHVSAWSDIWGNGRIDLLGNDKVSRITYSSLYYILSSIPDSLQDQKTFVGLSPGSLANGAAGRDYYGHVFWDQETWMFPPVLMLHTDLGKALVKTRIRTLDSAKEYASSRGYAGAMYTWESAYSGLDVCPAELYSNNEQHITGDVALAFQQYLRMSDDRKFLDHERGAEAIQNIADFWASRVSLNKSTNLYEINGVMPPDEYQHFINNSVYTNVVAKLSLQLVKEFASLNDNSKMQHYENIADKLYIPFNDSGQWHPEFEGYEEGTKVKQADVILLGYPLLYDIPEETRKNDLNIYEKVTPGGPAMTWGMFAIGLLEIGNIQKAKEIFERQFLNNAGPFNIWTEVADGNGAVNFITGMGGFLQSVIFGYGGFRILPNQLAFNCNMPPETNQFNIYGLDYLGASLDFNFTESDMTITLTRQGSVGLKVVLSNTQSHDLRVGQPLKLKSQRALIEKIDRKTRSTTVMPSHIAHDNGCQKTFVQSWLTLFLVTLCIFYNVFS